MTRFVNKQMELAMHFAFLVSTLAVISASAGVRSEQSMLQLEQSCTEYCNEPELVEGIKVRWDVKHERKLKTAGQPAAFSYTLATTDWPSGQECYDLKRKILVLAHLPNNYNTTGIALVTAVRLDNSLDRHKVAINDNRCSIDAQWDTYDGWPHPLEVQFTSLTGITTKIVVPPVSDADAITIRTKVYGLTVVQYTGEIPRNIFWCARDDFSSQPSVSAKLVSLVRAQHVGWRYFDIPLRTIPDVVERLAGPAFRQAIETLQPNAYKADVLRLVLLHFIGGVWLDTKLTPLMPLDAILPQKGGMFPWDIGQRGIFNAFIALPRGDPLAKYVLQRILQNVAQKRYGPSDLHVTGPRLFFDVIREEGLLSPPNSYHIPWILSDRGVLLQDIVTGQSTMTVLNVEYRRKVVSKHDYCHYGQLWRRREVYYERRCNPNAGLNYW